MENKGTVLICDSEDAFLSQVESELQNEGIAVDTINDASGLIPRALRVKPGVIIVNPDMNGFNEFDVCKNLKQGMDIPIILLFDKHSTGRNQIDECTADDVLVKPVKIDNLSFLISKHLAMNQ